jgi:hypothetical protein
MTVSLNRSFDWNSLEPQRIYEYLENYGWEEERKLDDMAAILSINKNDKKYSILLPLDKEISDFTSRMYDVFRTLEVVEERPKGDRLY